MSKILVAYATKTGCTEGVAEKIGEVLAARGATVDVVPVKKGPDPAAYDAVIVGSGVRVGSWHGSAKKWVVANADALKARPVAFFTACMTMVSEPEQRDVILGFSGSVIEESGVEPLDIGLFAGWFVPERTGFAARAILKKMETPEGDFRDWDAIASWSSAILDRLAVSA